MGVEGRRDEAELVERLAHAKSNGNDVCGLRAFFIMASLTFESGHR
jgi:hypothetical protein